MSPDRAEVPVFVLREGLGTRMKQETDVPPKPMVPLGNHPALWHGMRSHSGHGLKRFILCLGFKAEVIESYLLNYSDSSSLLGPGPMRKFGVLPGLGTGRGMGGGDRKDR